MAEEAGIDNFMRVPVSLLWVCLFALNVDARVRAPICVSER